MMFRTYKIMIGPFVSRFEKRSHFAQNAKIWQFLTYRNLKTPGALGFRLGI